VEKVTSGGKTNYAKKNTAIAARSKLDVALLIVEGLSSIFGFTGIALIIDPTGRIIELPESELSGIPIPIHNFFLPGLWLVIVYGIGLALTTYFLYTEKLFARSLAAFLGLVWLGWITFEMIFIGPSIFIAIWYLPQVIALFLLALTRRSSSLDKVARSSL
jgi:hypothetical protein